MRNGGWTLVFCITHPRNVFFLICILVENSSLSDIQLFAFVWQVAWDDDNGIEQVLKDAGLA